MTDWAKRTQTASRQRRSLRLPAFDYASPGVYFVTLCASKRRYFFRNPHMRQFAETCWLAIPAHNPGVTLDEWVLMPNHLHGLIEIHEHPSETPENHRRGVQLNAPTMETDEIVGGLEQPTSIGVDPSSYYASISPRRGTLSVIVRTYKAAVTTACRRKGYLAFEWQRNYFEHVVRNARELDAIRRYIRLNPLRWELDRDNPANTRRLPPPVTIADYLADLAVDHDVP